MTFPELMYYAECDGSLPTRAGKINAVIKDVKRYPHPEIGMNAFEAILNKHGLTFNSLTRRERRYIEASIK